MYQRCWFKIMQAGMHMCIHSIINGVTCVSSGQLMLLQGMHQKDVQTSMARMIASVIATC